MANLRLDNIKNDLYYSINSKKISDSDILNDCLYTNIGNTQEYPTIKLVSVIFNYKKKNKNLDPNTPILTFKNTDCIVLLND